MTFPPDGRSSGARALWCVVPGLLLPGRDEAAANVYLPGTAFTGAFSTRDAEPVGLGLPLRVYAEPGTTCLRTSVRGPLGAGLPAGHHRLDAEIPMSEMCGTLQLDVEMTGATTCSDNEHFSGYIITTGR